MAQALYVGAETDILKSLTPDDIGDYFSSFSGTYESSQGWSIDSNTGTSYTAAVDIPLIEVRIEYDPDITDITDVYLSGKKVGTDDGNGNFSYVGSMEAGGYLYINMSDHDESDSLSTKAVVYISVSAGKKSAARKCSCMYCGVGGVARKVKAAYIGVNGIAKLFYSKSSDETHTHTWHIGSYSQHDESQHYENYFCSCGAMYQKPASHSYDTSVDGNTTTRTCRYCGFWYSITSECAHDYAGEVTTAATCTTDGVKTYTCSKCGNSYTETISALGHSFNLATCTEPKTCSRCGATIGSALGHSWQPTGAVDVNLGSEYECTVCGEHMWSRITS